MFFLGWHEIRQTLYESLPEGVVDFGKKFDRYIDEGHAGVHVHFRVCTTPPGLHAARPSPVTHFEVVGGLLKFRRIAHPTTGVMGCLILCCTYQDGAEVQAKVLIGADGYFSGVRAQMLNDGPPEFTGNVMWRARFPLRSGFTTDRTR